MKLFRLSVPLLVLLAACAYREQRPSNGVSDTSQMNPSATAQPLPPEVASTTHTTRAGAPAEERKAPISASVAPDPSGTHVDRRVSDRIRKALVEDDAIRDVAIERVRIETVDGNVTLSGLVPTVADKVAIEQRVRAVKNVKAVDNRIEVLP